MKVTVSEIKNNLQRTNNGRAEAENPLRINDLEHKEEKKH